MQTPASLFGMFVCTRTSIWDERKPCDEAVLVPYLYRDERTVRDPAELPFDGHTWYEYGQNHRVENGNIVRDLPCSRWMIHIPDAAALQKFCETHRQLVLSINTSGPEPCYELKIYDDYRE